MSPRSTGRTQRCGAEQARLRLRQARAFLEVAELVGNEPDEMASPGVGVPPWRFSPASPQVTPPAVLHSAHAHADKITGRLWSYSVRLRTTERRWPEILIVCCQ